ncbi:alpha/beta fold hydrolase [Limibacter armeniacum]|uniref:alpha/beta hydrolase family protein n=1 Tax=Limibacter armeniacum TaxID=466084 RepID=UPI002FE5BA3E
MRKYNQVIYILFIGCLTLIFNTKAIAQQDRFEGRWVGTAELLPYPEFVSFSVDTLPVVRFFYNEIPSHVPKSYEFSKDTIYFEVDTDQLYAEYKGVLTSDSTMEGKMTVGGEAYDCNLQRVTPASLEDIGYLLGYFQFENGKVIQMEPFFLDGTINPLQLLDYETGKKRVIFPVYRDEQTLKFTAGKKLLTPVPLDFAVTLHMNKVGEAERLSFTDLSGETIPLNEGKMLQNLDKQQDISATNGDVTLYGTITYPNSQVDKHPLVVYIPAAGQQFRGNMLDEYIRLLPYYGVATLVYDKRGCGESTGNLRESTFEDQAADVEALLKEALKQEKIDVANVGLVGFDQAGFIMPIVASQSDEVKFIVNLSGAVVSLEEQEYGALSNRMKADGFPEQDVKDALAYHQQMFAYLKGDLDSVAFQQASDAISIKPWNNYVTSFDNKDYISWWSRYYNFSPDKYWRQVNVPVLTLYGENDLIVDTDKNVQRMEKYIKKSKRSGSDVQVLKNANHLLMLGEKRGDFQLSEIVGYEPTLFDIIINWVGSQTGLQEK